MQTADLAFPELRISVLRYRRDGLNGPPRGPTLSHAGGGQIACRLPLAEYVLESIEVGTTDKKNTGITTKREAGAVCGEIGEEPCSAVNNWLLITRTNVQLTPFSLGTSWRKLLQSHR
jgi:hypothetical protein